MKDHLLGFLAFALSITACAPTPTPPAEAEVLEHLVGEYCDQEQDYRLQLIDDGRYFFRKISPAVLPTQVVSYEKCSGDFEVLIEGDSVMIHFMKDPRPRNSQFEDCDTTMLIWTPTSGYVVGADTVRIFDLFAGKTEMTKGLCE